MADKLPGISLSESDFISMLQGFISKGDIKKKVDVEVNGSKEIEKLTNNFEKLNSIRTDQLTGQLEKISTLLSVRFKGVNLNQFTSKLIRAFQDPTKSAEDLSSTINDVYTDLTTLASIDNSGSFVGFNESEIRRTIKKQQKVLELQKQFESEYSNASTKAKKQKPVDIITRARVEKIQKQSSSDVATLLGVDSSKINVKNGDDTLLQTYQQTADLLAKMVSEKKEYNKLNKANVGDYLKQEQDILSVFQQLQDIEKQISEKFGISSKDFLSNQFKGDNGQFDFVKNAEQAVKTYVTIMTSSTKKALQEAQTKLSEQLNTAATKSVDRLGTANEKVGKTSERLGGSGANPGDSTTVQAGAEIGESVASGMKTAEVATESATDRIKEYIVSIEDSIDEINRLQNIIDKGGLSDKEEDALLQKQAFHLANINRLNANKEQKELIESDALANAEDTFGLIKSGEFGKKAQEMLSQISSFTDSMQSVIDRWVSHNKKRINAETPEQFMVANDQTGFILEGANKIVGGIEGQSIRKALFDSKGQGNSIIHSHPDEQVAAFSFDDIQAAIGQKVKGIIHQYVVSLNDISFLDVSQFTDEQLSSIVEQFKQNAYFSVGKDSYLDSTKAFETINTSIDLYIDNILSDLRSFLGSDSEKVDFSSLKLSIQNAIKEEGIEDVEDFAAVAQESISKVLDQKKIKYDLNDLEYKVTNPTTSKILQSFSEGELLKAIQSVVPNIDLSSVYKRTTLEDYNSGESLLPSKIEDVKTDISINSNDAEEKIKSLEASIQSLREELQRFKDTGIEPEGISELQTKLESAEQHIRSLSDELSLLYEHSVSESDYSRLEEELSLAKANAEDLRESLVQVKSELEQSKIEAPLDSSVLDEKVTTKFYRGVDLRGRGTLGEQGIYGQGSVSETPWFSSSIDVAKEYAGVLGEIYSLELDTNKIMTVDAQGEKWTHVLYLGQGEEEESKKLLSLYENLSQARKKLQEDFGWDGQDTSLLNIMKSSAEAQRAVMEYQKIQMDFKNSIGASDKYGYTSTDDLAKMAKEMGYQAIVIKNVMDSESGIIADNMSLLTGSMQGIRNASVQDLNGNIIETYNQEAEAARASADAAQTSSQADTQAAEAARARTDANNALAESEQAVTQAESAQAGATSGSSAQADQQAAEAAEQRAQANEHLAESEKQVDAAESANAGASDIPAQTDDVAVTESAIDAEMSKLDELKNKIATEIPQAVETKNNAFKEEQSVVEGAIGAEINKLDELKQKIDDVTNATKEKNKEFADGQNSNQSNSNKKDKAKKKSQNKTSNTSNQSKTDEDYINEGIGKYKELIKDVDKFAKLKAKAADPKETMTGGEVVKLEEFNNKLKEANQLAEQYGTKSEELTSIQQRFNEVFNVSNQHFQANTKSAKEAAKEQEKAAKQTAEAARKEQEKARKEAEKIQREQATALKNTEKLYANISDGDKTRFEDQFNAVQSAYKRVIGSKGDLNEYQEFIYSLKELQKYSKIGPGEILPKESFSFDEAKAQAEQIVNSYKNVTKGLSGSTQVDDKGLAHWSATVKDAQGNVQQLQFTWNAATNQMAQQARQLPKETVGIGAAIDGVKKKVKELATYWTARLFDPYRLIGGVKQVINIVREYDDALTEMRKVSDESLSTLKQFQQQSFGIADALGTTGKQIQNSTADWLRLGESFDEAKKSAEVSNLLLNVSEFTSIDDATQSLVSASQAYKDLDKIEIVDKLNNIGNNFSVSTDQLAQGLQNAAAVLHTQGNDIDQALALLTAGNAITQDISKTSAGVRTISLRIAGTEEAKNEVADLGEDIDDFVVRTRSKTDQIIRDYTAVASNNYKGVSVLDDNGNLRDTYDILLDIASVYKEIQQEDKQRGTNRANALVETLAGKNRSNIAASILENPELLKDVYEASQQSAGSAMQENEKYLDSISGKMQQMQNHLQEMANIVADSDGLKIILDIINEILSAITKIVDVAGGMSGILGAVGGIFLQKSGFVTGKNGILTQLLFGSSGNVSQTVKKTVKPLSDQLQSELYKWVNDGNFDMGGKFLEQMSSKGISLDAIRGSSTFGPIIEGMSQAEVEALKYSDVMNLAVKGTAELPQVVSKASAAFSTFTGVAKTVGSTLLSMGTAMIASFAIEGVIKLIYNLATAQKRAIEAGKEAQQNIAETAEGYKNTEESLKGVQDEFAKLSTGVDSKGNNVSLSTEEYDRFLELSSQIAEIAPELVTGYDAQGNAIVALGDSVDGVNGKFQEYLNLQRDIANADIGGNLDTVFTGIKGQVKSYRSELEKARQDYDKAQEILGEKRPENAFNVLGSLTHVKDLSTGNMIQLSQKMVDKNTDFITVSQDDLQSLLTLLADNGIYADAWEDDGSGIRTVPVNLSGADDNLLRKINGISNAGQADAMKYKALSDASVKKYELLIDSEYKKIIPSIQEYINTSPFFDELDGEELQKKFKDGFNNIFSNFDYQSLAKDIDEAGGLENFIDDFIFTMLANDDTKKAFEGLTDLAEQQGEMTVKEYREARSEYYKTIQDAYRDSATGETLYSDEYLNSIWGDDFGTRESNAAKKLGLTSRHDQQMFWDALREASMENEDAALTAIEQMSSGQAKRFVGRYSKIMDFIAPYLSGEKLKEKVDSTDTLDTLINDESYQKSAETASSHLSSLTGALETLRTEGSLTAEEMVNLQNSFPDLTEFTTESIQTKAFEELDGWIGKIREGMKGMSDESKKQAQTMIQNMVDQYGDLGVNMSDIAGTYFDSLGIDESKMSGQEMSSYTQDFYDKVEELRSRLEAEGKELDMHVLYTIIASDQFSNDANELYNNYNNAELNWKITLDRQRLEEEIQRQQVRAERYASIRELKEAKGETTTTEDYNQEVITSSRIAKAQREEADNAWDEYLKAQGTERAAKLEAYWKEASEADQAEADLIQKQKEQQEAGANEELANLEKSNDTLADAQRAITAAEKDGGKASSELYESVASQYDNQAETNRKLGDIYQSLADNTTNQAWKTEWTNTANDYYDKVLQAEADAKEQRLIPLQNEYNELQNEATAIEHELTEAEQKHQKVSAKTYQDLIANGNAQIRNLQKQQSKVKEYSEDWWTLQNSIDSMNDSIYDWSTTMDSIVYDQASQLAQTISTAMSESISETGLTDDTINALKTAFSDLDSSRFDVSDAFYSTADGVKVNTEALQELTEAEFELIGTPIADEIANVQAQLDKDPGNSALQQKLENLMETNAKYFAQYEEMQKALSRNAAIDLAESTSNAGANYDENYGRVKTYKEAYEKGLTGTDDFKAWTSYLDVYGRDTVEAYEAVSGKIERYFTEDAADGLGNFLTDMEKLGYAAQDADGYWTITADDYDAAAKDMQMGSEWFMDTMNKLEDFGFIHTYVSSLNEAQLKTRDVEEQIADAVQTYSDMVARGASDEDLQKQIEHINELESQWQDLDTVTKTWGETTEENRKKEFLGLDDQLAGFEEMYKNADTDAGREAAKKAAEDYVKQFGYTLEEGKFKLSADDLVDYESRITTFSGSMENPLTAEDMGISEENVEKFDEMKNGIQELAQSGDLTSIQDSLSGITAEQLRSIDYNDGKYTEGFEAAEGAVDKLRKQLGLGVEDTDLLIDAMTALGLVVDQKVDVPTKFDTLDNFLATATKGSGAGYQISTDISRLSTDELETQLSEISTLEVQIDKDSEVYDQLQELKKETEIQLNIKNSDQTQTQLKEWAETGNREQIAKTFGIDVNSEEVDQYIEQINNMPSDYDLVVHVDDEQFTQLISAIQEPWSMLITADTSEAEEAATDTKKKVEKTPIIQTIKQKVENFANAAAGFLGLPQKTEAMASMDTSGVIKGAKQAEKATKDVSKAKGTATADINIAPAMGKINQLRANLLSIAAIKPIISVDSSGLSSAIGRTQDLINRLRQAISLKSQASALGTAHSLGTTALSRAHANGTQDWTVGRDESALVNEIGQESIVRDGVWQLIPGGPHVEDLQADDIIFNAQQTADLIRTGKTARRGQLVAHANGTVPGMSAYGNTSGRNRGPSLKSNTKSSTKKNNRGNGGNGGNGGNTGNGKNKKKKSDFETWLEKLFDWIEVRLDRIQRRIDLATAKAENAIGYGNKNSNIVDAMNEIAKSAADANSAVIYRNKNGAVTGYSGGTDGTKIGDSIRGALRYQQQADKVAQKARSKGIFKGADMDTIIDKIQTGRIDINEYTDKQKKFIEAYKEWYDKSQDLVQATEDLKKQYKELEQTKLDNIVEEFETLTGYAEAVKASSEATVDYYNSAGFAKNTDTDRAEITKQRDRQNEITNTLINEIGAYKGELKNAEQIFGINSNQYREASTKLEEMNKSLIESQKTERELSHALYDLAKTVRGYFIDRVKSFVDKLSSITSLSEKRGTTQRYGIDIAQTEEPYFEQTRYNNELILKYYEDIKEAQREIAEEGAQINSERYEELYKTITDGESAITSLLSANEDLKESIRTLRWKGYNEFQKQLDSINSDLEHIQGFIRDGDIMDDDAQFTKLGFAQIALIGEQMDTAEKKIRNAQGAITKLGKEYQKHTISLEKYNEELDAQIDIIQDASGAMFDYQQKLADMYIDQITAENDALQDLISARKEALSAKKE